MTGREPGDACHHWSGTPALRRGGCRHAGRRCSALRRSSARLLCQRGLDDAGDGRPLPPIRRSTICTIRCAGGHGAWPSIGSWRRSRGRERIAVHGDYDVDGITSTVILRRALELLGGDVVHFIPERLRDGYGLQPAAIDRLHAEGVALIVSVDCGIRGTEAARRARELGVDLDHHRSSRAGRRAAAGARGDQSQAARLPLSRQEPRRRRRRAEAGAGAVSRDAGTRQLAAGLRQDRGHRHARRRRAARRREPRHRQARPRPADARTAQGRACARCSRSSGLARQDHRQLSHRVHAGAARQRRRPDEHAGHRHPPAAGVATRRWRRGAGARRSSSTTRTCGARRRRRRSLAAAPGRSWRPIRTSAPTSCWWSPATAGTAASSASSRRSWSTPFTGRPSCCRSTTTWRTGRAGASRASTCWRRSSVRAHLLSRFGGHKQAAGLQLEAARIKEFRRGVNAYAEARLGPDDLRPRLWLDGPLLFNEITTALSPSGQRRDGVAPFGPGNPGRVRHRAGVEVVDGPRRLKERHLKMRVRRTAACCAPSTGTPPRRKA